MQRVVESVVSEGRERGVQLAAYLDGNLVVDVWAGVDDADTKRPVDGDTLFPVFSSTKGIAATLVHLLVERGQLTYDTTVAEVWPEFAAHGKGGITVRHILNHTAGLPCMPLGIGYAELVDWETMCAAMADLTPMSEPGTQMIYHAITYGWLTGEVARRVDGRAFPQLMQEEICQKLGITGMYVGIPDEAESRVATLEDAFAPEASALPDDVLPQSVPGWMQPLTAVMNRPDARRTCLPGCSGIMTARALARHYAALLPGGVDGVELLPPERIGLATERHDPTDQSIEELPFRFALGYMLLSDCDERGAGRPPFGHPGHGGSIGFADPDHRLAVGFTKNLFSANDSQGLLLYELRQALGIDRAG
jgi:CubicO group peptidase (beta-lactamase class C family)